MFFFSLLLAAFRSINIFYFQPATGPDFCDLSILIFSLLFTENIPYCPVFASANLFYNLLQPTRHSHQKEKLEC